MDMEMDVDVNYAQTSYVHTDDKKNVSGDFCGSYVEMCDAFLVGEKEVEEMACTDIDWSYDVQENQEDVQMGSNEDEVTNFFGDQTIEFFSFVKLSTFGSPVFYQPHFCIRGPLISNSQYWTCEVGLFESENMGNGVAGATIGLNAMSPLFKDKSQEECRFEACHLGARFL
ncbi:hypothetical protein L484_020881 [Morus notabilis]|uniref:Uncharacterized protein n=1 Tax=Morus notabilis TaxID=981085 RepID=W9QRP3_9ROSA|nr:hypothetical protein L484_020881 [Morus notabilis]